MNQQTAFNAEYAEKLERTLSCPRRGALTLWANVKFFSVPLR
jgi:hypothetical protein